MGKSSSKQQPRSLAPSLIPMGQTNPLFQPQHHIIPVHIITQNQTFPSQLHRKWVNRHRLSNTQNLAPSTLIPMGQTNPMFQPQHHIIPMPCTQNQTFPSQLTSFVPMFPEQWFVPPSITPFTTTRAPVMFDDAVQMDQRVRRY
ncbi:hypothetical protein ACOME3_003141 [Neoechinorhynchus agilis]